MSIFVLILLHSLIYYQEVSSGKLWDKASIDFIIVGAGAAGSALASRLSEDGQYNVLLLEAGGEPETYNNIPYFSYGPLRGKLDWNYLSERQKSACLAFKHERCPIPAGKGLGGSTLINGMIYVRGNPKDFDRWEHLGNDGWGYKDVQPIFEKFEDMQDNSDENYGTERVTVARSPFTPELQQTFLDAGKELGYDEMDYGRSSYTGFSRTYFAIRNGLRLTAYKAYLESARSRLNLFIETNALVTKVEFDKHNRAVGVEFEKNGTTFTAKAKKEIIISAGALRSPQILILSGIGRENNLINFGIPIITNLSGVGKNLRDHVSVRSLLIELSSDIGFRIDKDATAENFELLETEGKGPLSVPGRILATAFVDTTSTDVASDWPNVELLFAQKSVDKQLRKDEHELSDEKCPVTNFIRNTLSLQRPKSVGYLTIQSTDPHDPPIIEPNYLSDVDDVKALVAGIKILTTVWNTAALKILGAKANLPVVIDGCEDAVFMSTEYLECYVRYYSGPGLHFCGTCKMGPKTDPSAVVDSKLRVHGVSNLRIVDNSVGPTQTAGHSMSTAFMIGEKAAQLIKEYWREI